MAYNITYLNQIVSDLGGSDTYIYEIDALNAICTLLGITDGHTYKIDALNAIDVNQGGSGGHKYNIEALNSIITLAGETGGYKYEPDAWAVIQQGALLNQNEPEVTAYIAGLTTPLSSTQIGKLNTFVAALKTGLGISALSDAFDVMYILAGETAESSLKNLVKNAHHATAVNSPAFTHFEGFTGNGTSSYLTNDYIPSTKAVRQTLNSVTYGFYIRSGITANDNHILFGGRQDVNTNSTLLQARISSNRFVTALNQGKSQVSDFNVSNDTNGIYTFVRDGVNSIKTYRNAGTLVTGTNVSTALTTVAMHILAFNNAGTPTGYCPYQISNLYTGRAFSQAEILSIQTAIEAYMDSNGKGVIA